MEKRYCTVKIDDYDLAEKLEKTYWRYGVNIIIKDWECCRDRIIYRAKTKGNTRKLQLQTYASDVQFRLKVPFFQVVIQGFNIFIVVSDQKIRYGHLPQIVQMQRYIELTKKMRLPYAVGYDFIGHLEVVDLSLSPHLLLGGSTCSGKTVGLQSLLANIAYSKPPSEVNFILIDVGATDLILFDEIPHLSCPVVRDRNLACQVLLALTDEMERRMELKVKNSMQFEKLPRLILAIDEFPALFSGLDDKYMTKLITNTISSLLQRGRHANIHVVLAAQNPTMHNMKVDLGNITARVAFRCAKKNFSETIIGEGGAEYLSGQGDMLFKSPQSAELKRLQGVYMSEQEFREVLSKIMLRWDRYSFANRFKFVIKKEALRQEEFDLRDNFIGKCLAKKGHDNIEEKLFAEIILWTLKQDAISCNMVMGNFNLGWKRANRFIERLYNLDIVGDLDAKLPRKVLSQSVTEISEETIRFLESNGFTAESVTAAIESRK